MSKQTKAGLTTLGVVLGIPGILLFGMYSPIVLGTILIVGTFGFLIAGFYQIFLDYYD